MTFSSMAPVIVSPKKLTSTQLGQLANELMPVKQEQKSSCLQSQKYSKYTQYLNQKANSYNKIY